MIDKIRAWYYRPSQIAFFVNAFLICLVLAEMLTIVKLTTGI